VDQTLIVIDRRTTDRSAEVAQKMGAQVLWEPLPGYGRAYRSGFNNIHTDLIVTLDADGTYPIEQIASMVDHLVDQKLDFLNGSRFPIRQVKSMTRTNWLGNRVITCVTQALYWRRTCDALSGMWVFRKSFLKDARFLSFGWNFSADIKIEAMTLPNVRFGETAIEYSPRVGETKLLPWKVGFMNLGFLFVKRVHTLLRGNL